MANSEILAAIKSFQSSFKNHLSVTNQMMKEFMSSFDSHLASLQPNKAPPGVPSPSNPSHPPSIEPTSFKKSNCGASPPVVPSPLSSSHPKPTELSPFMKPDSDASSGAAVIPFSYNTPSKSPMEALALAKTDEARLEESRIELRSGVCEPPPPTTLGPSTQQLLPQKSDALFQPPVEPPPPQHSLDHRIHPASKTGLISFFIDGIRSEIHSELSFAWPPTLMETSDLARAVEARLGEARADLKLSPCWNPRGFGPPSSSSSGVSNVRRMWEYWLLRRVILYREFFIYHSLTHLEDKVDFEEGRK